MLDPIFDTAVPRPSASRPRRPPRLQQPRRAVWLGGLLAILAVGCGLALRLGPLSAPGSRSDGGVTTARGAVTSVRRTTPVSPVRPFTAMVGDTTGCQTLAASAPQLLCPIPNGTVTYMQVTDLGTRYRAIAGDGDDVAARGDAACARGVNDERAWSRPDAPARIAGRYRCRVAATRAEMWWTVDDSGVFAHAMRSDGDLAALFSWWRTRAEHP